jgi:transcriptional regulator
MKAEVLKGHLDMLLLASVAAGAAHGYALIRRLREASGGVLEVPEGTLYPALHRLEAGALVASDWETAGGRRRRVYRLTPAGRRTLVRERSEWGVFSGAVESVLETL